MSTEIFDLASVKLENWKKKKKNPQSVTAKKKAFN